MFTCQVCKGRFRTQRAFSSHLLQSNFCNDKISFIPFPSHEIENALITNNQETLNFTDNTLGNTDCMDEEYYSENNAQFNDICSFLSDSGNTITQGNFHYTADIIQEIKLLKILNDLGTPLYAYKTILKWARDAQMSNYSFDSKRKTYQQNIMLQD